MCMKKKKIPSQQRCYNYINFKTCSSAVKVKEARTYITPDTETWNDSDNSVPEAITHLVSLIFKISKLLNFPFPTL